MRHPFQCIQTCYPSSRPTGILLAACASEIFSVSLQDYSVLCKWSSERSRSPSADIPASEEPPGKKRKLETVITKAPRIIKLICTSDARHVIAVTGEDKCIRVFKLDGETGQLEELSQRHMPKRPCAIALTADQKTILAGDKFGDVYGLPLIPSTEESKFASTESTSNGDDRNSITQERGYDGPAASELTVHSKKNLRALEMQRKMRDSGDKRKEGPTFEHKLLLGHVSMLTDLLMASGAPFEAAPEKAREYVITADRDEHIRVSRAPPQTHIIEGFCLGHEQFVNQLCLVSRDVLVSAGGDDYLLVWKWEQQQLVNRIELTRNLDPISLIDKEPLLDGENETVTEDAHVKSLAVTGLYRCPTIGVDGVSSEVLIITFEGIPALFYIRVEDLLQSDASERFKVAKVDGNPLDIAVHGTSVIVSVDNCSLPGSIRKCRPETAGFDFRLERLQLTDEGIRENIGQLDGCGEMVANVVDTQTFLYTVENLRKRGSED